MKNATRWIETSKAQWKQAKFGGGIDYIPLNMDLGEKTGTMIVRMAPNSVYPKHRHRGSEELFVLKGTLQIGEMILKPGDFLFTPAGTLHAMVTTEGCLFHVNAPQGIEIVSEAALEELDETAPMLSPEI